MKEICFNDVLFACSQALDYVEYELLGATDHHSKRVAWMGMELGNALGMEDKDLIDLVACALLHDNALAEYIATELRGTDTHQRMDIGIHCKLGERNIACLPMATNQDGAVLYHHENADGSGPFGRTAKETPLAAQIIHLADQLDVALDLGHWEEGKAAVIQGYLSMNRDRCFSGELVDLFWDTFTLSDLSSLEGGALEARIEARLPRRTALYSHKQFRDMATLFARITDYKSASTCQHSMGIAEKLEQMGRYYGYDAEGCMDLFMAGAFHDIGKLMVPNAVLEKPGRLTVGEYEIMKTHAEKSDGILSHIEGFETLRKWACQHHEKLDGSGYFKGLSAGDLDFEERLVACVDIYQALTEPRPYKSGLTHAVAIKMMSKMVEKHQIDGGIVGDLDRVMGRRSAFIH
ncbi:HD-GYP domain-containing protein [Eubacterium barkeri]|uniref:HD domain-containing protein n=1 Tax=Eubacterium barkeri TaxID=1528 RepID=A0A1H3I0C0_EUBBA|nr:HD domain-containing phosphohydrolase [Eubacterium barkeri]SDY21150.1 HD domain-containing protein [Eubacterium barkeri]